MRRSVTATLGLEQPTETVVKEVPSALAVQLQQNLDTGRILNWMTKEPGRFVLLPNGPFKGRLYVINDDGCPVRVRKDMLLVRKLVEEPTYG